MTSMVLRMALNPVILRERSEPNGSHAELQRQTHGAVNQGDPSTTLRMTERNDEGSQTTTQHNPAQLTPM